jgi:arabinogalactan endo-1,4-beta-galactosidase
MKDSIKAIIPLLLWLAGWPCAGELRESAAGMSRPDRIKEEAAFIQGADVSFIPQIEDLGGIYRDNGVPRDPLDILKDHGIRCIRLKLWHTPAEPYNTLEKVLGMARRIRERDLQFLLDFHYSDTWADPGRQTKPAAWTGLAFEALKDSVARYTRNVISALVRQNTRPDMVQIGNEINSGMLWNDGRVGGSFDTPAQWANLGELLKAGIRGVREGTDGADPIRILIHFANAANNAGCRWFFDRVITQGVSFDAIGLSYYPWWHGTLGNVRANLNDLAQRYGKNILILETAYPWTLQGADGTGNLVGSPGQLHPGYPATVDGQADFLHDLTAIVRNARNQKGTGVFYWAPEYISVPPIGSPWENVALFDFTGNALRSMDVFMEPPSDLAPVNATVRLNTATLMDTIGERHFVQIRGELSGLSYRELPDGRTVTWDSDSQLILRNTGGDYWEASFPMFPGDTLSYKYWSGFAPNRGTFQRLGWEGPILPAGGLTGNRRVLVAGEKDTVLEVEYYNSTGEAKDQFWRPFEHRNDSVAVTFRVNMGKATASGRFLPDTDGPVAVRGDADVSGGSLDWDASKVLLRREPFSVNGGSFWSGVCHIPKSAAAAGSELEYLFFIENGGPDGRESVVPNRRAEFSGSEADTTLHWVYFDEPAVPSSVAKGDPHPPPSFQLGQNYPNPFNLQTKIPYFLRKETRVVMTVNDVRGRTVSVPVRSRQQAGRHAACWDARSVDGAPLASGMYFVHLETDCGAEVRRILLLK